MPEKENYGKLEEDRTVRLSDERELFMILPSLYECKNVSLLRMSTNYLLQPTSFTI